jgi:hypothetical protein
MTSRVKASITEIDAIVKDSLQGKMAGRRAAMQDWHAVCDECGEVVTVAAISAHAARQAAQGRGWQFIGQVSGRDAAVCPVCVVERAARHAARRARMAREQQEAFC